MTSPRLAAAAASTRTEAEARAPSFQGALRLARQAAMQGHPAPSAVMAKLLMHVSVEDGGLLGADDAQAEAICLRCKISAAQYADALHAPGSWPEAQPERAVAA